MELSVFCIVVIVGVAWVPGDAQGGIVFEPKDPETKPPEPKHPETRPPEPKQEGGYIQPRDDGIYIEPKEEQIDTRQFRRCRYRLTVGDEGRTITSPRYPRNYPNRLRCAWRIKAQNPQATLKVECNDFNVVSSFLCLRDRFMIFENFALKKRFCGTGPKSYSSTTNNIRISFITNRRGTSRGFLCHLYAVLKDTTTTSTTESTTTTSTTESTTTTSTTESTTTTSTTESTTTTSTTESTTTTSACDCGVINLERIVGGVDVNPPHKYPWQVGIKYSNDSNYWCGGSIICKRYVLTAAHCVKRGNNFIDTDGLVVGVGDHNMDSSADDVSGVTRLVDVEKVIAHEDYSSSDLDNDIALLKLSEDLDLSPKEIGAVCLPADDSKTYEGVMATASGWGTLSSGGQQPDILNEVTLPILEPSCWGMPVTENMVCAGLENGGKDTCQGDSGGPLTVEEDSKYVQVGITSWGYGCADPSSPGVYARVSKFLPWIKSKTADGDCCF